MKVGHLETHQAVCPVRPTLTVIFPCDETKRSKDTYTAKIDDSMTISVKAKKVKTKGDVGKGAVRPERPGLQRRCEQELKAAATLTHRDTSGADNRFLGASKRETCEGQARSFAKAATQKFKHRFLCKARRATRTHTRARANTHAHASTQTSKSERAHTQRFLGTPARLHTTKVPRT